MYIEQPEAQYAIIEAVLLWKEVSVKEIEVGCETNSMDSWITNKIHRKQSAIQWH